ncbi:hypothetical protein BC830DRAFT_1230762 [Chytriomyces sp. MP71]|nr:hypothetical protein BC830DRAFT_1230762 [Chytriomyces sp. MP71]
MNPNAREFTPTTPTLAPSQKSLSPTAPEFTPSPSSLAPLTTAPQLEDTWTQQQASTAALSNWSRKPNPLAPEFTPALEWGVGGAGYVNPERHLSGGAEKKKLSPQELSQKMEKMRIMNAEILKQQEAAEEDQALFEASLQVQRAREAEEAAKERRAREAMEELRRERAENARKKAESKAGREWDMQKGRELCKTPVKTPVESVPIFSEKSPMSAVGRQREQSGAANRGSGGGRGNGHMKRGEVVLSPNGIPMESALRMDVIKTDASIPMTRPAANSGYTARGGREHERGGHRGNFSRRGSDASFYRGEKPPAGMAAKYGVENPSVMPSIV